MSRDFNTLLIPVESQVRELDGKLLLACMAAERSFDCVFGSRAHVHYHCSKVKNAIYLAKSMRRFSDRMFKILHGLGHRIIAWDEEALVRLPDQQYYLHRLSPNTFKYIDHLFSWGESDAIVFENYPHYLNQPIHRFGNPRIDILRPELRNYFAPEKDTLTKKFGNYVLINTNFGQVNHFIPDVGKQEVSRDKNFSANDNDEFIKHRHSHKSTLFKYFKELVPYLAQTFPEINFILRPHPSESIDSWKQKISTFSNVTVSNQGNVIPWIMGAKAIISNGCTTSIEATILDIPTLGYYPIENEKIDDKLPKAVSHIARSKESLVVSLKKTLACRNFDKDKSPLNYHISNINGELSCKKILDTIDQHYSETHYRKKNIIETLPSKIHNNARTRIKKFKSNQSSSRNSSEYHKHRFPPIDTSYLYERVNRLQSLTNQFQNIKIKNISDDLFLFSK